MTLKEENRKLIRVNHPHRPWNSIFT